jgi:hypothetical protein
MAMNLALLGIIFILIGFGAREFCHFRLMVLSFILAALLLGADWYHQTGCFPWQGRFCP